MHLVYLSLPPPHPSLSRATLMCSCWQDGPESFVVQRQAEIFLSLRSDEGLAGAFLLYQTERLLEKQEQFLEALLENHCSTT